MFAICKPSLRVCGNATQRHRVNKLSFLLGLLLYSPSSIQSRKENWTLYHKFTLLRANLDFHFHNCYFWRKTTLLSWISHLRLGHWQFRRTWHSLTAVMLGTVLLRYFVDAMTLSRVRVVSSFQVSTSCYFLTVLGFFVVVADLHRDSQTFFKIPDWACSYLECYEADKISEYIVLMITYQGNVGFCLLSLSNVDCWEPF